MWPYLCVGGYYVVEDVATGANRNGQRYGARSKRALPFYPPGYSPLVHNASFVSEATTRLFHEHDVFFVDTLIGHRAPGRRHPARPSAAGGKALLLGVSAAAARHAPHGP